MLPLNKGDAICLKKCSRFLLFNIQCAAYQDENGTRYVSKLISCNTVSVGIILVFVKLSFPFLCNFGIWNQLNRSFIFLSLISSMLELFVSAKFGSIRSLSSASGTLFTASGKSSQHIMWVPILWPLLSTEQIRAGTLSSNSRLQGPVSWGSAAMESCYLEVGGCTTNNMLQRISVGREGYWSRARSTAHTFMK